MSGMDPARYPIQELSGWDKRNLTSEQLQALQVREQMWARRRNLVRRERELAQLREQMLCERQVEQARELRRNLDLVKSEFVKRTEALRTTAARIKKWPAPQTQTFEYDRALAELLERVQRWRERDEQDHAKKAFGQPVPKDLNRSLVAPLTFFRFFCDKPNREHLEIVAADLSKDIVEMRAEGHTERYVRAAVWWAIVTTLGGLAWDTAKRRLGRLLLLAAIRRLFMG